MRVPTLVKLFLTISGPLRIWDPTLPSEHAGHLLSRAAWNRYSGALQPSFLILPPLAGPVAATLTKQWCWPPYHLRQLPPIQPHHSGQLFSALNPIGESHHFTRKPMPWPRMTTTATSWPRRHLVKALSILVWAINICDVHTSFNPTRQINSSLKFPRIVWKIPHSSTLTC